MKFELITARGAGKKTMHYFYLRKVMLAIIALHENEREGYIFGNCLEYLFTIATTILF